jgi:hypothetical protein
MAKRLTKEIRYISLPEKRIEEIRRLVASWPYETKAFMRSRLNQYSPPSDWLNTLLENVLSFFLTAPERRFEILKDPEKPIPSRPGTRFWKRKYGQGLHLSVVAVGQGSR